MHKYNDNWPCSNWLIAQYFQSTVVYNSHLEEFEDTKGVIRICKSKNRDYEMYKHNDSWLYNNGLIEQYFHSIVLEVYFCPTEIKETTCNLGTKDF